MMGCGERLGCVGMSAGGLVGRVGWDGCSAYLSLHAYDISVPSPVRRWNETDTDHLLYGHCLLYVWVHHVSFLCR